MKYVLSVVIILFIGTPLFADDISPTRNDDKKLIKVEGGCLGPNYYVHGNLSNLKDIELLLEINDKEIDDYLKNSEELFTWGYGLSFFAGFPLLGGLLLWINGYSPWFFVIGCVPAAICLTLGFISDYYILKAVNRYNYIIQHQSMNSLNEPCFIIGRRSF
jgi:hypothetical protein